MTMHRRRSTTARWSRIAVTLLGVGAIVAAVPASATAQSASLDRSLLDRYCVTCHNETLRTGGLALDSVDLQDAAAHAEVLEKVVHKLHAGQMPPVGRPRPQPAAIKAFTAALETALDREAAAAPNPGRLAVHRLNRLEYVNAIRDLLGLEIDPAMLPVDNPGLGFDNNADVLSVTPALMSRYLSAATKVSRLAMGNPAIRSVMQVYRASEFAYQDVRMGDDMPFGTRGGLAVRHAFPLDGEYAFRLRLQRNSVGDVIRGIDQEQEIEVRIDKALVQTFTVGGKYQGPDPGILIAIPEEDVEDQALHTYRLSADAHLEFRLAVTAGTRLVTAAFTDNAPAMTEAIPTLPSSIKRRVFFDDAEEPGIDILQIAGPYDGTVPQDTASRQRIFVCRPANATDAAPCAREVLGALARRAYRRPVTEADVDGLMRLYTIGSQDGDFDAGIELALEGLLAAPAFLFRIGHDPTDAPAGTVYRLSDLELASRLSFFLWKSFPDDELLAVAADGRLADPAVLDQQVRRLLADPKATRWMNDFVAQWLTVRNIQAHEPNPDMFAGFDDNLRDAMERETLLFFEDQVRDNQPLLDLLRADTTFLNARLARHYGVPGVYGTHFRRVSVTDPARRGLLGQASILTVTSYAHRTSVVLRGKWVLETLLGAPPPPPPPNVPPLEENRPGAAPTSLRERMERHRENAVCAACHMAMDPPGFALENFDPIGRWRDTDGGVPIDAGTTLNDGSEVEGPAGFREYLLGRSDEFLRTVTEKLLAYALGRELRYYDVPTVRQIVRDAGGEEARWTPVILGIVKSVPFQMRRVSAPGETPAVTAVAAR